MFSAFFSFSASVHFHFIWHLRSQALEKTVSRDPTAPHYKYHDDPYLIPMSNLSKRSYALSKESGRKAAMWILKEHANLFQHKHADPEIPVICHF